MNPTTQRLLIPGPKGSLEVALDEPTPGVKARGLAVLAHPHPLFGGTLDNKVTQTMARAVIAQGVISLRPNFRGVGKSDGQHDNGLGEVEDLWAAWQWLLTQYPQAGELRWIGGFSFGAVMATHLAHDWASHPVASGQPDLDRVVLVGLGISPDRRQPAPLTPAARVIHGEEDEVIPLKDVFNWLRPQNIPLTVLPGAGHFFHARLTDLKTCITRSLLA